MKWSVAQLPHQSNLHCCL